MENFSQHQAEEKVSGDEECLMTHSDAVSGPRGSFVHTWAAAVMSTVPTRPRASAHSKQLLASLGPIMLQTCPLTGIRRRARTLQMFWNITGAHDSCFL